MAIASDAPMASFMGVPMKHVSLITVRGIESTLGGGGQANGVTAHISEFGFNSGKSSSARPQIHTNSAKQSGPTDQM